MNVEKASGGASPVTMAPTDERMVPESADDNTVLEHLYRYKFAASFVRGKKVLDIACGEGYGSAGLLRAGASEIVGVDISAESCQHALAKYGLNAIVGSAEAIPLPENSVDVVVSFETIEHLEAPLKFVTEVARVLRPGGQFVVSTPNRPVFREVALDNPFHHSEMSYDELKNLLDVPFTATAFFSQRPLRVAGLRPRMFASEKASWDNLRGFRRVRKSVRKLFGCQAEQLLTSGARMNPADWIGTSAIPGPAFANPFRVVPFDASAGEEPLFIIAVATL